MTEPMLELSVRITDGSYESKITMPVDASDKARKEFVEQWLMLQQSGLRVLQSRAKAPESKP